MNPLKISDAAYPQSWYPLCRSADLRQGQVIRQQALGIPLAVWRTAQNRVAALHAPCSHMGADLSRGRVVGERLQCPLHQWEYGVTGACERIPHQDRIPARARQLAFPCEEHYGLVFAFLGGEPAFAFPRFAPPLSKLERGLGGEVYSRPSITDIEAPHHVLVANSFDGQHFATVHRRELLAPPQIASLAPQHLCIQYQAKVAGHHLSDRLLRAAGIATVANEIHCWGGNLMLVYNRRTVNTIFVGILPVERRRSRVFISTVMDARSKGWVAGAGRRVLLAVAHWLTLAFLKPDLAVLQGLTLRPKVLLPEADACFIQWLRYWRKLPRNTPTELIGECAEDDEALAKALER